MKDVSSFFVAKIVEEVGVVFDSDDVAHIHFVMVFVFAVHINKVHSTNDIQGNIGIDIVGDLKNY